MGAAALGAGVPPGYLIIHFDDVHEGQITTANDKAGSKRAARKAVTELLS